ncbi:MAG: cupin, partial [Euzebyales bacterium]|nr:cupin [Euzebyales bacterium]
ARHPGAVADAAAERFWSGRRPRLSGQLRQLLALDEIDDATKVARRPGAICRLTAAGDRITAQLGDRRLHMPADLAAAMAAVTERPELTVGDLAELLDQPSRHVLVRRLVREGLLMVVR